MRTFTKVTKLVIDRTKWLRGGRNGKGNSSPSCLRVPGGCMCCLGFLSLETGLTEGEITGYSMVDRIAAARGLGRATIPRLTRRPVVGPGRSYNTIFSGEAAGINDSVALNDKDRESRLTALFQLQDIDLTFVGKTYMGL